jgi:hypothetical protein
MRAVTAARGAVDVCICYVIMRFFFPHVLVVPVTVLTAGLCSAGFLGRFRVRLDTEGGDVAITSGFWTRHVPLTHIERVDEALRFGVEIKAGGGRTYRFGPFSKRRRFARWLRIRTGFEGMELAVTAAAAAARPAPDRLAPDRPAPDRPARDRPAAVSPAPADSAGGHGLPAAGLVCVAGLFSLAVAARVHPQAGGWLVQAGAVLLRIMYGGGGAVVVLIGAGMLVGVWRGRRTPVGGT